MATIIVTVIQLLTPKTRGQGECEYLYSTKTSHVDTLRYEHTYRLRPHCMAACRFFRGQLTQEVIIKFTLTATQVIFRYRWSLRAFTSYTTLLLLSLENRNMRTSSVCYVDAARVCRGSLEIPIVTLIYAHLVPIHERHQMWMSRIRKRTEIIRKNSGIRN